MKNLLKASALTCLLSGTIFGYGALPIVDESSFASTLTYTFSPIQSAIGVDPVLQCSEFAYSMLKSLKKKGIEIKSVSCELVNDDNYNAVFTRK